MSSKVLNALRDTIYAVTSCCFPNPTIAINRRTFKVIKLLGEGGFSFVYLVQDVTTGRLYALKKIRCPFGSEAVADAMREVEMYRMFQHENIIKVLDTQVVSDKDGSKIVYIFLPYYKRGNLLEAINSNTVNKKHFSERDILRFFKGVCYAIRALHTHRLPAVPMVSNDNSRGGEGDDTGESTGLVSNEEEGNVNVEETPRLGEHAGDVVPYAHRDVKPGNILISDDGQTPILMDFGSIIRARVKIQTRQQAIQQQDLAAEHSTMSYRAPELFDVKTGTTIDEKVDIWSLGCTLYAMAYGQSPFEANMNEQGGSMALAVLNNQFRFPTDAEFQDLYSTELRDLISSCLVTNPENRPDIHQLLEKVNSMLQSGVYDD